MFSSGINESFAFLFIPSSDFVSLLCLLGEHMLEVPVPKSEISISDRKSLSSFGTSATPISCPHIVDAFDVETAVSYTHLDVYKRQH